LFAQEAKSWGDIHTMLKKNDTAMHRWNAELRALGERLIAAGVQPGLGLPVTRFSPSRDCKRQLLSR
jgi:hypothetical protein